MFDPNKTGRTIYDVVLAVMTAVRKKYRSSKPRGRAFYITVMMFFVIYGPYQLMYLPNVMYANMAWDVKNEVLLNYKNPSFKYDELYLKQQRVCRFFLKRQNWFIFAGPSKAWDTAGCDNPMLPTKPFPAILPKAPKKTPFDRNKFPKTMFSSNQNRRRVHM